MPANLVVGTSVETAPLQAGLAIATAEFRKAKAEVSALAKEIAATSDQALRSQLTPQLNAAAIESAKLGAEVNKLKAEIKEMGAESGGALAHFHESILQAGEGVEALNAKLGAVTGVAGKLSELFLVGLGAEKVFSSIEGFAEYGDKLLHLHEETGLAIEDVQALKYAGELSDVQFDMMARSLGKFTTSIQQAETGSGAAADAFRGLGITQEELRTHGNNAAEMLTLVAEHLDKFGDGFNKLAYVEALFGTRQKEMLLVLKQLGDEGLEGVRARLAALGVQFDEDFAVQAKKAKGQIVDMKTEVDALAAELGHQLAPALDYVARGFRELNQSIRVSEGKALFDTAIPTDQLKERLGKLQEQLKVAEANSDPGTHLGYGRDKAKEAQLEAELLKNEIQATEKVIALRDEEAAKKADHPAAAKPELPPLHEKDDEGEKGFVRHWENQIKIQEDAQNLLGEKGKAFELQFWKSARELAESSGYTEAVGEITNKILALRNSAAAKGASEDKRELSGWQATYIAGIEDQIKAAKGNWGEQRRLVREWQNEARTVFGQTTAEFAAAQRAMTAVSERENAARATEIKKSAEQGIRDLEKAQGHDLASAKRNDSHVFGATPEQVEADQAFIIEHAAELKDRLLAFYREEAAGNAKLLEEINRLQDEANQERTDKLRAADDEAQQAIRAEWEKTNKDIASGLSGAIMDGLEGKKGGLGAGLQKWFQGQVQSTLEQGISGLLGQGESALGIDKKSPGGLVGGGLDALGLGDVAKFFGLGGENSKDQPLIASQSQLISSINQLRATFTELRPSLAQAGGGGAPQNSDAANQNQSMAQMTNSIDGLEAPMMGLSKEMGINSGFTKAANVVQEANTIATLINTIATDALAIIDFVLSLKPFAEGGEPPVGVPSIVGERGPELFVPNSAGTIIPNYALPSYARGLPGAPGGSPVATVNSQTSSRGGDSASFHQTNHISTSADRPLHQQIADVLKASGHSGVRALAHKLRS